MFTYCSQRFAVVDSLCNTNYTGSTLTYDLYWSLPEVADEWDVKVVASRLSCV